MKKMCWKATIDGKSWVADCLSSKFVLSYAIGKTTNPKVGKILCFKTYEDLKGFLLHEFIFNDMKRNRSHTIVFKGWAENPSPLKFVSCVDDGDITEFWKYKLKWKKGVPWEIDHKDAPRGTLCTFAFTPTEQFTYDEFRRLEMKVEQRER